MFAAPVPPSTPKRDQSFHPPPATGPYVITSSKPSGWSYARNPAWGSRNGPRLPQLPDGRVDRIKVRVVRNPEAEASDVIAGKADWMQNPPTPTRFAELWPSYGGTQLRVDPTLSTYYFWMNTKKPPFDDVRVRRAANYAVDPLVLEGIYGGQIVPTHQILPPGMPGFEQFDLYPYDLAKARRLVAQAHLPDHKITVWTDNESPNDEAGAYFAGQLRKIGFRVRLKVIDAAYYFSVIGSSSTSNLDAGWGDWFADYGHPDDFFRPMLLGSTILPFYNANFAQIDVPDLNSRLQKLNERRLGPATERAYAALDRDYMRLAPWVPYGTRVLSTFVSKHVDLNGVVWNTLFGADLASFEFK
jgi:peptide/nickel transport system substrate-binding protein